MSPSISFILDVEELAAIATIVVFNADDDLSDYEATVSIYAYDESTESIIRVTLIQLGSCKVIE